MKQPSQHLYFALFLSGAVFLFALGYPIAQAVAVVLSIAAFSTAMGMAKHFLEK